MRFTALLASIFGINGTTSLPKAAPELPQALRFQSFNKDVVRNQRQRRKLERQVPQNRKK